MGNPNKLLQKFDLDWQPAKISRWLVGLIQIQISPQNLIVFFILRPTTFQRFYENSYFSNSADQARNKHRENIIFLAELLTMSTWSRLSFYHFVLHEISPWLSVVSIYVVSSKQQRCVYVTVTSGTVDRCYVARTASRRFISRARRITSKWSSYCWDTAQPLKRLPR